MEIEELFGLPAHPLVVHAVVVLLPLAAIGALVCAALPSTRRPYGPLVLAAALASVLCVLVAQGSGEELEHDVQKSHLVEEHAERGDQVLPWAIGVAVVAAGITALPSIERRRALPATATTVVAVVLALGIGAGAVTSVARAGHSGSKAVWSDLDAGRDRPSG